MEDEKDLTCFDCVGFNECLIWSTDHIDEDSLPCMAFVHQENDSTPGDKSYLKRATPKGL